MKKNDRNETGEGHCGWVCDRSAVKKILEFVSMDDESFFNYITRGASEEDVETYLNEFPEYRKFKKEKKETP